MRHGSCSPFIRIWEFPSIERVTMEFRIIDITNREGVQSPGVHLSRLARVMFLLGLDRCGITEAEIGFPVLRHDSSAIHAVLQLVHAGHLRSLVPYGWVRATTEDVERAHEHCPGLKNLSLSVPASDTLIRAKFRGNFSARNVLHRASESVHRARELGYENLTVGLEDASRTPLPRLREFCRELLEAGAHRFRYADTVGLETPFRIRERIAELVGVTGLPFVIHSHNDLGMAVAVSLAGMMGGHDAGVNMYADVTVNGLGERAGNCDLLSLNMAMRYACGVPEGLPRASQAVDLNMAAWLSGYVSLETGIPVPDRYPVTGKANMIHESGIHTDALLKSPETYRPFESRPDVQSPSRNPGANADEIRVGPYSGVKTLLHIYEQLDTRFDDRVQASDVLELVQEATRQSRRPLVKEELIFIAQNAAIARDILFPWDRTETCSPMRSTGQTCLPG